MRPEDFNPQSPNAMFSMVLGRLDAQDKVLQRIEAGQTHTTARIVDLERSRWMQRGALAVGASVIAGWEWFKAHFKG